MKRLSEIPSTLSNHKSPKMCGQYATVRRAEYALNDKAGASQKGEEPWNALLFMCRALNKNYIHAPDHRGQVLF